MLLFCQVDAKRAGFSSKLCKSDRRFEKFRSMHKSGFSATIILSDFLFESSAKECDNRESY